MKRNRMTTPRRSTKKGMPPGSLVHIGSAFPGQEELTCHQYDGTQWSKSHDFKVCKPGPDDRVTTWVEMSGLTDNARLSPIFEQLKVNTLILEDILNTDQNAKTDMGENWVCFILKNIHWSPATLDWSAEQISLVLQPNLIVSFAEKKSDLFQPVYRRLAVDTSKIRTHGSDFTFCTLLDVMVDEYLEICELLENCVEEIEMKMEDRGDYNPTQTVHQIRKFQIYFRHQLAPLKEGITKLIRESDHLISTDDLPYYDDILDHINQAMNQLDQIRDNLASIRDMYLTQINTAMNKVIKLLTIVSTIFIPVTFIAGIYGMNFTNMPELNWKFGYPAVLLIMVLLGFGTYLFFRRKNWM